MRTTRISLALAVVAGLAAAAPPTLASEEIDVDLELIFAVDVSGSVDYEEAKLQREGYLTALAHPQVLAAVRSGMLGRIAIAYFEWSSHGQNALVANWAIIDGEASAKAFVKNVADIPVTRGRYTSIAGAIELGMPMFNGNGLNGTRRVIDVSGDGPNNSGPLVTFSRDAAVAAGITINGLPIVNERAEPFGARQLPDLDLYYEACVIGGSRAFMVVAQDFTAFADAVRKKLVIEIAGLSAEDLAGGPKARALGMPDIAAEAPSPIRFVGTEIAQGRPGAAAERVAPACDIGERMMQDRMRGFDPNR